MPPVGTTPQHAAAATSPVSGAVEVMVTFYRGVYSSTAQVLERFCREMADPMELPVLAGVFLLKSAKNASFINNKVPGANIPDHLIARLEAASDPAAEGVVIAAEQVRQFSGIAQGVHVMAVRAEQRIPEVLERAGLSSQPS